MGFEYSLYRTPKDAVTTQNPKLLIITQDWDGEARAPLLLKRPASFEGSMRDTDSEEGCYTDKLRQRHICPVDEEVTVSSPLAYYDHRSLVVVS